MDKDRVFPESPPRKAVVLFLMSTVALIRYMIRHRLCKGYDGERKSQEGHHA